MRDSARRGVVPAAASALMLLLLGGVVAAPNPKPSITVVIFV